MKEWKQISHKMNLGLQSNYCVNPVLWDPNKPFLTLRGRLSPTQGGTGLPMGRKKIPVLRARNHFQALTIPTRLLLRAWRSSATSIYWSLVSHQKKAEPPGGSPRQEKNSPSVRGWIWGF